MASLHHIHKSALIKGAATIILIVLGFAVFFGGASTYFTWLAARDGKLLAMHDRQHEKRLADHCGKKGTVVRNGTTGGYACLYVNPDDSWVIRSIPSAPLLAAAPKL